jgi:hypothetical protein
MSIIENRWFLTLMVSGLLAVTAGCPEPEGDGGSDGTSDGTATDAGSSDGSTDGTMTDAGTGPVAATMDYHFESPFAGCEGEDGVGYGGQTFRHVLITAVKGYMKTVDGDAATNSELTAATIMTNLNAHYEGPTGDLAANDQPISITDSDDNAVVTVQATFGDFNSTKNLKGKISGEDNAVISQDGDADAMTTMVGWTSTCDNGDAGVVDCAPTPHQLVQDWFQAFADAAADKAANGTVNWDPTVAEADRTDDDKLPSYATLAGHDYQQLLQKFLLGAVTFSQGADDYLDQGRGKSNAQIEGKCYSDLMHAWDEGYGYFGGSRYYASQTDAENKEGWKDQDADGKIDLTTEYNYGHSVNAAKRDLGTTDTTDFTADAFNALHAGRALINGAGETLTADEATLLETHADTAISAWEKAIASTVVHYIKNVLEDMGKFGTADYSHATHAKHWSELKGFAMSFQFNGASPMLGMNSLSTATHFDDLHMLIGQAPVLPSADTEVINAYIVSLNDARALIETAYGFAAANIADW